MDSSNKNKTIIILLGIFSLMLVMNILMPLHRDDFDYSVIWHTQAHVGSLQDVIASCWNHYLSTWCRWYIINVFLVINILTTYL